MSIERRRSFRGRYRAALFLAFVIAVLSAGASPSETAGRPSAGVRSLGDPLLPQLGNGGYDVEHYRIEIDYDPAANRFESATTTITATARRHLKSFSFDFQDDLTVSAVRVNGRTAHHRVEAAKPRLSVDPTVTQPMKIVVVPEVPSRPRPGASFTVVVEYSGSRLAIRVDHGDGHATWHWREDDPTATYLVTATVGDFDFDVGSAIEKSTRRRLPVFTAIDAGATRAQRVAIDAALAAAPAQIDFLSNLYGPYPFDSTGAVADRVAGVGYALEVQTKPHYAGDFDTGAPSIPIDTQLHEIAHQWWGNSVTPQGWNDLWLSEGWVTWSTWHWEHLERGGRDPAVLFADFYANTPAEAWSIAPAVLDRDPAMLFSDFPTYDRAAMTIEGYRQIVGNETFFAVARAIQIRFRHRNLSTVDFIHFATRRSGLTGARLELLDEYFRQWLYGEERPTVVPTNFD